MDSKVTRAWLNPANCGNGRFSFVLVEVTEGRDSYDDHQLVIQDCRGNITLDFPAGKKGRKKALTKLGKLYDALNLIEEALEDHDD